MNFFVAGNEKIVDMLIKNGANVNAVNNAGDVPLNLAAAEGNCLK